jgi:hypothetical protein
VKGVRLASFALQVVDGGSSFQIWIAGDQVSVLHMPPEEDSVQHIMAACVYTRQVWFGCLRRLELNLDIPQVAEPWQDWWLRVRAAFRTKERRGFDALVILVSW